MYNTLLESQIKKYYGNRDYLPAEILPLLDCISREYDKMEKQLEAEANLSALIENTQDIIWSVDREFRILSYNSAFAEVMKSYFSKASDTGINVLNMVPPEDARIWKGYYERALQGKRFSIEEECLLRGCRQYYQISFNPIRSDNGITGVSVFKENITKRKTMELELIKSGNDAVEYAKSKAIFMSAIVHEMKTHINDVLKSADILSGFPEGPARQLARDIKAGENSLLKIVNDVLDFSEIEFDNEEQNSVFNLAECIEETYDILAPAVSEKKLELLYLIDPDVPFFFHGDFIRLRQILLKLTDNAAKFTMHGEIFIHAQLAAHDKEDNVVLISVKDTGAGIPPEKLAHLFDPFSGTFSKSNRPGLGLLICKQLVTSMGGKIWAVSTPCEGTTINFTVKLKPAAQPEKNIADSSSMLGKKILIVDDNETHLKILNINLKRWGLTPFYTSSSHEALELLVGDLNFDLSLVGHTIPGMDGIKLAGEIRKLKLKDKLPVILLFPPEDQHKLQLPDGICSSVIFRPLKLGLLYELIAGILTNV